MENNSLQFKFDGNSKDFGKISKDAVWLLNETLNKDIKEIDIEISEGDEKNYIQGLVIDVFSESGVLLKFK